jgi:hypothetical protein
MDALQFGKIKNFKFLQLAQISLKYNENTEYLLLNNVYCLILFILIYTV